MLGGFDGAAARPAASVDAMEARKERRWIIRELLYSRQIGSACVLGSAAAHLACLMVPGGGLLEPGRPGLLDAALYSPASSRQPSGGSIGAVMGHCIEGNRRAWSTLMNSVDDGFE